jgi:hypothetical protein
VFPQFWITSEGMKPWFKTKPQCPGSNQVMSLGFFGDFILNIWNYSEQSFLVDAVEMERTDVCMIGHERKNYLQIVVTPHTVGTIDLSVPIMRLLTHTY